MSTGQARPHYLKQRSRSQMARKPDAIETRKLQQQQQQLKEALSHKEEAQNESVSYLTMLTYLFNWDYGVFKMIWTDLALWLAIYFAINITYRLILPSSMRLTFVRIVMSMNAWQNSMPVTFLLGFFVSNVVSSWWRAFVEIPTIRSACLVLHSCLHSQLLDQNQRQRQRDRQRSSRSMRAAGYRFHIARYLNLAYILAFRQESGKMKERFRKIRSTVSQFNRVHDDPNTTDEIYMNASKDQGNVNLFDDLTVNQRLYPALLSIGTRASTASTAAAAAAATAAADGPIYENFVRRFSLDDVVERVEEEEEVELDVYEEVGDVDALDEITSEESAANVDEVTETLVIINQDPVISKTFHEIVSPSELQIFQRLAKRLPAKQSLSYSLPLHWANELATRALQEGLCANYDAFLEINHMIRAWGKSLSNCSKYAKKHIPLVYTQVVIIAVYSWYFAETIASQFIDTKHVQMQNSTEADVEESKVSIDSKYYIDFFFPFLPLLKVVFVMGWFKVAMVVMTPFGKDKEGLPISLFLTDNLQLSSQFATFPKWLLPRKLWSKSRDCLDSDEEDVKEMISKKLGPWRPSSVMRRKSVSHAAADSHV